MARVVWTRQALADVRAVREFIARDAPLVAEVLTDRIFGSVDRLEVFPLPLEFRVSNPFSVR